MYTKIRFLMFFSEDANFFYDLMKHIELQAINCAWVLMFM